LSFNTTLDVSLLVLLWLLYLLLLITEENTMFYLPLNELFWDVCEEFKPFFKFNYFNWLTSTDDLFDLYDYFSLHI